MRFLLWTSLLFLVCFCTDVRPSAAEDLPDAASLQAKIDAADSAPPNNFRQTIVGHGTLGDRSETTFSLGKDDRTIFTSGTVREETGTSDGGAWRRNANGLTIADDPAPEDPKHEHRTLTVARSTSPAALVLSDLTDRGYGTKTYVDPATFRMLRKDRIDESGTSTTTYASYENFSGRMLASTWTAYDADTKSTMTYSRTAYVVGDVTAADVAVPGSRELVTFPAGVTRVELPTTFSNGGITVHATAGGQKADFALDSGSDEITISPNLAHRLGLILTNKVSVTIAKRVDITQAVVPVLKIGTLQLHDLVVNVVNIGNSQSDDEDLGLLGFDFFATLGVSIDYLHQHVTVTDGSVYKPPAGRTRVPLRLGDQVAMTSVTIDGAHADNMTIDTGGGGTTFMLFDSFSRRHPEVFRTPVMSSTEFYGVGGRFATEAWKMHNIQLGTLTLQEFTGYKVTDRASYQGGDGIIGIEFLRHFNVDFDYLDGQMFLQPNGDGFFVAH